MVLLVSIIQFSLLSFITYIALEYYSINISTGYFGLFMLPFVVGVTIFITGLVVGVFRSIKNIGINRIDFWLLGILTLSAIISFLYGNDIIKTWFEVLF